jgi:hypothetical protein
MSQPQRGRAGTLSGPHSVSLKVLRLSRPSLATQDPLPPTAFGDGLDISPQAGFANPSALDAAEAGGAAGPGGSAFSLTPLLMLPAAFGAAYVGETFACTLCANNELPPLDGEDVQGHTGKSVSDVQIVAALQSSSHQQGLTLALEGDSDTKGEELESGATIQRTLRHELKDEGPHVLAVTVTYTETTRTGAAADIARTRTFRKLYQFVSQPLIAVRSKVTERSKRTSDAPGALRSWILEAQLENVGEATVVMKKVYLKEKEGITSEAIGSYGGEDGDDVKEAVVLKPQDVEQVMFLVSEKTQPAVSEITTRPILAQLSVEWQSVMGEKGSLTTGWLAGKPR